MANLKYKIMVLVNKEKRRRRKNTLVKKNSIKPTFFGPENLVMILLVKNTESSTST